MTTWTPATILRAAAEWVWIPPGAEQLRTPDYQLIAYPADYALPTQVAWCASEQPAAELIDEVAERVRAWGRDRVSWWLSGSTRPAGLAGELAARGAAQVQHVAVLAHELRGGLPALAPPAGVSTEVVHGEAAVRGWHAVSDAVWRDGRATAEAQIAEEAAQDEPEPGGFRVLARVGGAPAAIGGCTIADGVARLWGAATLPELRGRGAYRAVVAERLRLAVARGATLALVKGRVETSGPILARAGFVRHGEERCVTLPLRGAAESDRR